MKVLLTGATGFVGSHMLERLVADGHQVRAVVRDRMALDKPPGRGSVDGISGDVVTGAGLEEAARGCEAAIHLVGIIVEPKGRDNANATFEKVHHQGTVNVLNAARAAGVKRWVQMSALGARPNGVSEYQTSKWRAEEAVRDAGGKTGMEWVILRPSIIFGPRDGFVTQMIEVMRSTPIFRPVPGHGRYPFRPVYIADVVECFAQSLTSREAVGQAIELVGGEELTLDALLAAVAEAMGVRKPAVHVPFGLMYMNAKIMGKLLKRPPVTPDQLRMLQEGSTADPEPMQRIFRLRPIGFREGLGRYLSRTSA